MPYVAVRDLPHILYLQDRHRFQVFGELSQLIIVARFRNIGGLFLNLSTCSSTKSGNHAKGQGKRIRTTASRC